MLHGRTLRAGIVKTYKGKEEDNSITNIKKVEQKRLAEERVDMDTYRHELRQFITEMGIAFTPEHRFNCEFGWKIINHNIWDEQFWARNDARRTFISEMIDTLDDITKSQSSAETIASLDKILEFIAKFIQLHIAEIRALLAVEQASGSLETTRRENLLNVRIPWLKTFA